MASTQFCYQYRDADNYKAQNTIALKGVILKDIWDAALTRLGSGEFFVAEQLAIPPLYQALYTFSNGPTSADHRWHEFVSICVADDMDASHFVWGNASEFVAQLMAVDEWKGQLSPHFWLGVYRKQTYTGS